MNRDFVGHAVGDIGSFGELCILGRIGCSNFRCLFPEETERTLYAKSQTQVQSTIQQFSNLTNQQFNNRTINPMNKDLSLETLLMHFGEDRSAYEGAVVPPMFQNSLFTFESWEAIDEAYEDRTNHFIYSRGKNPTVQIAERKLALLAGAEKAQLFPSGIRR